jgi:tetratricopeptide (TPR) repeat protein
MNKADQAFIKGYRFYSKGKFEQAIKNITEATMINPTNQRYLFIRAKAFIKLNLPKLACLDLEKITDSSFTEVGELINKYCH